MPNNQAAARVHQKFNSIGADEMFKMPIVKIGMVAAAVAYLIDKPLDTNREFVLLVRESLSLFYNAHDLKLPGYGSVKEAINAAQVVHQEIGVLKARMEEFEDRHERGECQEHTHVALAKAIKFGYNYDSQDQVPEDDVGDGAGDGDDSADGREEDVGAGVGGGGDGSEDVDGDVVEIVADKNEEDGATGPGGPNRPLPARLPALEAEVIDLLTPEKENPGKMRPERAQPKDFQPQAPAGAKTSYNYVHIASGGNITLHLQ